MKYLKNDITPQHFLKISYLLIVSIFFSCNADRNKKVDVDEFDFSTTDASELYFKNIRESYYNVEEKDGIKVFRLKAYDDIEKSVMKPMIVYHWRTDKAYLMLEFSDDVDAEDISLQLAGSAQNYEIVQIKDHLALANDLYNTINEEKECLLNQGGELTPLFSETSEKSNFSLVLYDFFRFTNVY